MDKIFVNGLRAKKPNENAPDFVIADLSAKVADLHEWLNENQGLANDAGYINLSLKKSKAGKYYIEVNTWKPKQDNHPAPRKEYYTPDGGDDIPEIDNSDVPF